MAFNHAMGFIFWFVLVPLCTFPQADADVPTRSVDKNNENSVINSIERSLGDELCETLLCKKSEVCTVYGHIAQCECRKSCPNINSPICASNGKTYPSHCHLFLETCNSNVKLAVISRGPCEIENVQLKSSENEELVHNDENVQLPHDDENVSSKRNNEGVQLQSSQKEVNGSLNFRVNQEAEVADPKLNNREHEETTTPETRMVLPTTAQKQCERDDFIFISSNLLLYFHAKFAENSRGEVEHGKTFLIHLMFSEFDIDGDKILTKSELEYAEKDERYTKLMPPSCHLIHLLQFGDADGNGELSDLEFYAIFGLSVDYLPQSKTVKTYFAEIGKQYQLYCDIALHNNPNERITWYRYDVPLVNVVPYNFEVSADGSLYLTPASLLHTGNFTCRVGAGSSLEQKHIVHVQERPVVAVEPEFLLLKTGESGKLRCTVVKGHPTPGIVWEKNAVKIAENISVLELPNVKPQDTGSYKCVATNVISSDYVTSSVVVRDDYEQPEMFLRNVEQEKSPKMVVLHESGIGVFNIFDCSLSKVIFDTTVNKKFEKTQLSCENKQCRWSDVATTKDPSVVYAALIEQRVLVKINLSSGSIDEVFQINHIPMRLWYVWWEDTLWIESWHDKTGHYRSIQVLRSASKPISHTLTHALPTHDEFDSVENVFVPVAGELSYGYVTHWKEVALHKFDLQTLKIVSRVSLASYGCHPSAIEFVVQSGLVVVNCVQSNGTTSIGQLLLDYMSDSVLSFDAGIHGTPTVTPDGQLLITVDAGLGRVFAQNVSEKELILWRTMDEFLPLSHWSVYPSAKTNSWLLYATPYFSNQIIEIDFSATKVRTFLDENVHSGKVVKGEKLERFLLTPKDIHYLITASNVGLGVMDMYETSFICRISDKFSGTKLVVVTNSV